MKKSRLWVSDDVAGDSDFFELLPDDLVLSILRKLVSTTTSQPTDFFNAILTCKRFNRLGFHRYVLSKARPSAFGVDAKTWCESSHKFLKRCVEAGNAEASYTLGMIRFYCLEMRRNGAALMAKAAMNNHSSALYSLAVIQFNGSGGSKNDKDLKAGVALAARAAYLGHIDAIRELGHCLQDGYGVGQNIAEGRRFLVEANAREITAILSTSSQYGYGSAEKCPWTRWYPKHRHVPDSPCPLLSDFGCSIPPPTPHLANKFLSDWFNLRDVAEGLRLCSHAGCGRPETRRHEYRRCSVCGTVNYCSRACQALDWKFRHKRDCVPVMPPEPWAYYDGVEEVVAGQVEGAEEGAAEEDDVIVDGNGNGNGDVLLTGKTQG